jgi:hypothetical protein
VNCGHVEHGLEARNVVVSSICKDKVRFPVKPALVRGRQGSCPILNALKTKSGVSGLKGDFVPGPMGAKGSASAFKLGLPVVHPKVFGVLGTKNGAAALSRDMATVQLNRSS